MKYIIAFILVYLYNACALYGVVADRNSLLEALKTATVNDTIYIQADVSIDLSGLSNIEIPGGITIYGLGASMNDRPLIFSENIPSEIRINPLFVINGDNVVIARIRLQGPSSGRADFSNLSIPGTVGISNRGFNNSLIKDCEIFGWEFSGIYFYDNSRDNEVINNNIHNNLRSGYGYGICIGDSSYALIEHNEFDFNRHDIAGGGCPFSGYTARYNTVGENGTSHSFDMHGGADRNDGTDYAGCCIIIEHNKFHTKNHWAVAIRGKPKKFGIIKNNYFYGNKNNVRSNAVKQINSFGNLFVGPNYFEYNYELKQEDGWLIKYADSDSVEWLLQTNYSFNKVYSGDFNGDGIDDIFVVDSSARWQVSWSALSGWQTINRQPLAEFNLKQVVVGDFTGDSIDDILLIANDGWYLSRQGRGDPIKVFEANRNVSRIFSGSLTSEGDTDIIYYDGEDWLVVSDNFTKETVYDMPFNGFKPIILADINGNGITEIVWEEHNKIYINNESNERILLFYDKRLEDIALIDYYGNGTKELFFSDGENWYVKIIDTEYAEKIFQSSIPINNLLFADFNGDGRTDIIFKNYTD